MKVVKTVLIYGFVLVLGLGIGGGIKYGYQRFTQPPAIMEMDTRVHFEHADTPIVLYTTTWCSYCKKARVFLAANDLPYTDYDIESGVQAVTERYESIGYRGVPKIVIGDKVINGFNEAVLMNELKAQKLL